MNRIGFIGGSDLGDMFGLEPYGCMRRLRLIKREVEPSDNIPDWKQRLFDRGKAMENIILDKYKDEYMGEGDSIEAHPEEKTIGRLTLHPDAIVTWEDGSKTLLEAKAVGSWVFRKAKKGEINPAYEVQAQAYAEAYGCDAALLVFLGVESFELLLVEVKITKDNSVLESLVKSVNEWYERHVTNGEDIEPLPYTDNRCKSCEYKTLCHGDFNIDAIRDEAEELPYHEDIDTLIDEYLNAKEKVVELKKMIESMAEGKPGLLGNNGRKVYWSVYDRSSVNTQKMRKEMPDVVKQFTETKTIRSLRIKGVDDE